MLFQKIYTCVIMNVDEKDKKITKAFIWIMDNIYLIKTIKRCFIYVVGSFILLVAILLLKPETSSWIFTPTV